MTSILMTKPQVTSLGKQIRSPLLMQSEVPVNIFPWRGEAASVAFAIPSQLNTYKTPNPRSLLGADCLCLRPPPQKKVCLGVSPTFSLGRRCTGLLCLHSPSSLHVRETPGARACFLLQTTHLPCWHGAARVRAPREAQSSVSSLLHPDYKLTQ